eukprot:Platyproteum_vivax@DN1364_c0_g1_i1.p1
MGRPTAVAIDKKNGLSNANAHSSNPHGWAGPKTARTLAELDAESDSEEDARKTRPRIGQPAGSATDIKNVGLTAATLKPSTLHGRSDTIARQNVVAKTLAPLESESDSEDDAHGSELRGWSRIKNPEIMVPKTLAELDAESDSEENAHKTRPRIRAMPCGSQKDPTSTAKPSTLHGRSKTEAIHDAKTLAQLDSESDSEEDARGSKLHGWSARKNPK